MTFGKDTFDVLILKVICKIKVVEKVFKCESVQSVQMKVSKVIKSESVQSESAGKGPKVKVPKVKVIVFLLMYNTVSYDERVKMPV
jgi:hypothetical protein